MDTTSLKSQFLLNEDITFLNFGSFGATPKSVFDRYQNYQLEMERDPVQFMTVRLSQYLKKSRESLASYITCDADDIVMVLNPSYAVNTVAKSIDWIEGDEILTTDLEYGACDRTWKLICSQVGAKYVRQPIQLPLSDEQLFVDNLFAGVTDRTKMIFISHITSTTALILPVAAVAAKARSLGIPVFIDGAHVPGHIPLNLNTLDVDYYTGACHKWMMTPKGSSFMYVKKSLQQNIKPLVVSWGYEALFPSHSTFLDWHSLNGTRDYTASLCISDSIAFMDLHDWASVAKRSRELLKEYAQTFSELLESPLLAPLQDDFIGQMLSVEIKTTDPEKLYRTFVDEYRIEIPVMRHDDKVYLRYSINGFNTAQDLDLLMAAIKDLKKKGSLL
jgi:isopenicillin-N epimerase